MKYVVTEDVDDVFERAVGAGAEIVDNRSRWIVGAVVAQSERVSPC